MLSVGMLSAMAAHHLANGHFNYSHFVYIWSYSHFYNINLIVQIAVNAQSRYAGCH